MLPSALLRVSSRRLPRHAIHPVSTRRASSSAREPSRHAQFYTEFAAGMIPVAILGSAVYLGLRTWQQYLAHERFLEEAQAHVQQLEAEVSALREQLQAAGHETPAGDAPASVKKSTWRFW
ncbi:hypothetical protein BN946_scf185043.g88 [Trametes cinnabarina]|uniref:Uncharacterized protein n=1 Tax=Pycnoporus cinnabarinus TaxID=5643 RepID=A0A060SNL7_PYCCI|nr:hypothetical protein BN946_scf185043.g88 [Trametes cinnabarina]